MTTETTGRLEIPAPADFHVHLRQGEMTELVAPHVAQGGIMLGYVMPNLVPPIRTTDEALAYHSRLCKIAPDTQFLVTLYLHPELTPDEVRAAARSRIVGGVKSYPRGVTTNSEGGIEDYHVYYPVFEAMQECGLVLNLHGEVPSDADKNISVLNAEAEFLSHLHRLHHDFPRLRIVLEHATTRAAVEAVRACGDTVACTITAHHLALTVDDWAGRPFHFCKPVAKTPDDRAALRDVVREGHPRFFLGSDSAPHGAAAKMPSPATHGGAQHVYEVGCAAGVYTSPVLLPLCATLLERFGALQQLSGFVSEHGRRFYGLDTATDSAATVVLRRASSDTDARIPAAYVHPAHTQRSDTDSTKLHVVPFWAGRPLAWVLEASQSTSSSSQTNKHNMTR